MIEPNPSETEGWPGRQLGHSVTEAQNYVKRSWGTSYLNAENINEFFTAIWRWNHTGQGFISMTAHPWTKMQQIAYSNSDAYRRCGAESFSPCH